MVKFAKNGSDVTTAAVKLARAFTGRDMMAICAEHAFFSTDDWFIGSTPMAAGIPAAIRDLTIKFHFNDIESLAGYSTATLTGSHASSWKPKPSIEPADNFLQDVQRLCREKGALFILDEMITGFRWHLGGAQRLYGITPDLSCFGKAIANGFARLSARGEKEVMELGGLFHDKERVFLLSTTHGAETHAIAAAIRTMRMYREERVVEYLWRQGEKLCSRLNAVSASWVLGDFFFVLGKPCNLVYATRDQDKMPSQEFRALFLQETIKRGLLMPSLVISFAHSDEDIDKTVQGVGEALLVYRKALEEGVEKYLVGRPVKPVFRVYN